MALRRDHCVMNVSKMSGVGRKVLRRGQQEMMMYKVLNIKATGYLCVPSS